MSELVVGARKAPTTRPWRAAVIAGAIAITASIVAWFIYRKSITYDMPDVVVAGGLSNGTDPAAPKLVFGDSQLAWRGGIAHLITSGEPHQMGAAHGRLLGASTQAFTNSTEACLRALVGDGGLLESWWPSMVLDWKLRFIDDGLADSDRRWLAGIVRGANQSGAALSYRSLVHATAAVDVGEPSPRTSEADTHVIAKSLSVVTTLANDPARLWVASSLSFPGFDDGGEGLAPVVTVAKPTNKLAWLGVGWPGQAGVIAGVNSAGIAIVVHGVRSSGVRATRPARPTTMIARSVLEGAKTIAQAVDLIDNGESLGAAAFVIIDGNESKFVVVERTPDKTVTNRSPAAVIGDLFENPAYQTDPQNDRARRQLTSSKRIARASKLLATPLADLGSLAGLLRDYRSTEDAVLPLGHRAALGEVGATLQFVMDPKARMIWVADPTSHYRMRGFDARSHFGITTASVPIPDLGPDPQSEAGEHARVLAAKRELRAARAALQRRQPTQASDFVARALTLAPTLPECLEVAAIAANANGDLPTARAFAQRWLEIGADNPAGEARARAIATR